ncbi:heterokaryon incompatibility, partial [Acephala macrosclerotiorum]
GEVGNWLILSHCWGESSGYFNTLSNLRHGINSLPSDGLPASVRHAIRVTRSIGFQYLCVDSICILQGSDAEAQADWLVGSSHMRDYYKGGVFCIAVDDASSDKRDSFMQDR